MIWRYVLDARYETFAPELMSVDYTGQWLMIRHCRLAIAPGYAWDGCSPSLRLPGGIWVGAPDGPLGADGRPVAWHASLVHDALCQFREEIRGVTKQSTIRLFRRLLREHGAPDWMCALYPVAVNHFGPQQWGGLSPA